MLWNWKKSVMLLNTSKHTKNNILFKLYVRRDCRRIFFLYIPYGFSLPYPLSVEMLPPFRGRNFHVTISNWYTFLQFFCCNIRCQMNALLSILSAGKNENIFHLCYNTLVDNSLTHMPRWRRQSSFLTIREVRSQRNPLCGSSRGTSAGLIKGNLCTAVPRKHLPDWSKEAFARQFQGNICRTDQREFLHGSWRDSFSGQLI